MLIKLTKNKDRERHFLNIEEILFPQPGKIIYSFLLCFFIALPIFSQSIDEQRLLFPGVYYTNTLAAERLKEDTALYSAMTQEEAQASAPITADQRSLLLNNDILAYYGHPNSKNMGILGRYSMEELDKQLVKLAAEYKAAGGRNVVTAFYIIYGTVWPEGEIGVINEETLLKYINYAQERNMLVFIDHQIGKYDPATAIKKMLPYLKYPNVHLALDPEWRTLKPMKEIGQVSATEINQVQELMEDYMKKNSIQGERMLVIHQFKPWMITERGRIKGNFSKVRVIHCADGFGNPNQKRSSYKANAFDDYNNETPKKPTLNLPLKSFKLFYNFNIPGAGFDNPLFSPKEVYALEPRPYLIMYQ
ncbi:MAG: hypothetical protein LBE74_02870 [Treponema sp.]|jgi:hypothetical protein|nr:hypothetical protein [Treponema sp.]